MLAGIYYMYLCRRCASYVYFNNKLLVPLASGQGHFRPAAMHVYIQPYIHVHSYSYNISYIHIEWMSRPWTHNIIPGSYKLYSSIINLCIVFWNRSSVRKWSNQMINEWKCTHVHFRGTMAVIVVPDTSNEYQMNNLLLRLNWDVDQLCR